jgi:hypothetical protein
MTTSLCYYYDRRIVAVCFVVIFMGSCLKGAKKETTVEFSSTTNVATTCKLGLKGENVKVSLNREKNTYSLSGKGIAIGSCGLDCDTACWEVHIGKNPNGIKVGVVRFNPKKPTSLEEPMDGKGDGVTPSWCFSDHQVKEGDIVGICWDQTDLPMLSFCVNGDLISTGAVTRIRPANDLFPAVSVDEGSTCAVVFDGNNFIKGSPSSKFPAIVCATSLI